MSEVYGFAVQGSDGEPVDPHDLWVPCPRCDFAAMVWIQSCYQCPACHFKEGCCSGI